MNVSIKQQMWLERDVSQTNSSCLAPTPIHPEACL